ncbi:MAG: bifunctional precorrin-2 dehydrogenase/sirohydrochlorin ferrochelatase, partial [Moraxellaceae bacterium]
MDFLPISLKLNQQPCLIVGGGNIAYRKAQLLAAAGAKIDVLAPEIAPQLLQLIQQTVGQHIVQAYTNLVNLRGYRLIIAATNDAVVNAQVFHDCEALNILVNSVDDPPHCRFMTPSIIDRSPLVLSIATGGASPVMARQLRTQIEGLLPTRL